MRSWVDNKFYDPLLLSSFFGMMWVGDFTPFVINVSLGYLISLSVIKYGVVSFTKFKLRKSAVDKRVDFIRLNLVMGLLLLNRIETHGHLVERVIDDEFNGNVPSFIDNRH
jgi:hypothetical protein